MTASVLVFLRAYLPAYKSGGPVRTIAGLVAALGEEIDFKIVTRDRDSGDARAFDNLRPDSWTRVGAAEVNYRSPQGLRATRLRQLMVSTSYDALYLNSFFDLDFAIKPLALWRLRLTRDVPVIVAPRGEFSPGALRIKARKKQLYIALFRRLGNDARLVWQASSEQEADDIRTVLSSASSGRRAAPKIVVAPNLAEISATPVALNALKGPVLRVAFLSRLSRKKNLDFAIRVLGRVNAARVLFHVYGPAPRPDDVKYLDECSRLARELPPNIEYEYRGDVRNQDVASVLARYDLFLLPTWGENYGHAIREALAAGLPVLLSDRTPWRDLEAARVGWDLSLDDPDAFARAITCVATMSPEEHAAVRQNCRRYAEVRTNSPDALAANRVLFESALAHGAHG